MDSQPTRRRGPRPPARGPAQALIVTGCGLALALAVGAWLAGLYGHADARDAASAGWAALVLLAGPLVVAAIRGRPPRWAGGAGRLDRKAWTRREARLWSACFAAQSALAFWLTERV